VILKLPTLDATAGHVPDIGASAILAYEHFQQCTCMFGEWGSLLVAFPPYDNRVIGPVNITGLDIRVFILK
jgi:hypothetical protein